jgi:hypothetical protein
MSLPVYIVDIIGAAVQLAETNVLTTIQENETCALGGTGITTVNYQKGHKLELIETLLQWSKVPDYDQRKYPCVYLVQDFQEIRNPRPGIYADVKLNLILMHFTEQTYRVDDRYANVFKPVLYPLYDAFLEGLAKTPQIQQSNKDDIQHTKIDRLYWGRQAAGGNDRVALTDYLDAIEITGLQLSIYFKTC